MHSFLCDDSRSFELHYAFQVYTIKKRKKKRARYARALVYAEAAVLKRAMCFVRLGSYHCVQKVDIA